MFPLWYLGVLIHDLTHTEKPAFVRKAVEALLCAVVVGASSLAFKDALWQAMNPEWCSPLSMSGLGIGRLNGPLIKGGLGSAFLMVPTLFLLKRVSDGERARKTDKLFRYLGDLTFHSI